MGRPDTACWPAVAAVEAAVAAGKWDTAAVTAEQIRGGIRWLASSSVPGVGAVVETLVLPVPAPAVGVAAEDDMPDLLRLRGVQG